MFADRRATAAPASRTPFSAYTTRQENPDLLDALHERLVSEYAPQGTIETHLVWSLAMALWRAERAAKLERSVLDQTPPTTAALDSSVRFSESQQEQLCRTLDQLFKLQARRDGGGMRVWPGLPHAAGGSTIPANDVAGEPTATAS